LSLLEGQGKVSEVTFVETPYSTSYIHCSVQCFLFILRPSPSSSSALKFFNTSLLGPVTMRSSLWAASVLCATALSAPTYSTSAAARSVEMRVLSGYFQLLGRKVQDEKNMAQAPVCNMNNAVMPIACKLLNFHATIQSN
jgi:hypothetical protein